MQSAHSAESYRQVRQLEIEIENKRHKEDRAQERQQREEEKRKHEEDWAKERQQQEEEKREREEDRKDHRKLMKVMMMNFMNKGDGSS